MAYGAAACHASVGPVSLRRPSVEGHPAPDFVSVDMRLQAAAKEPRGQPPPPPPASAQPSAGVVDALPPSLRWAWVRPGHEFPQTPQKPLELGAEPGDDETPPKDV